jgi:hypothetical protein
MSQAEQWKLTAIIMLPYFALLWVYLRLVPQPPLLVDVLVFPGSLFLYFLILRWFGVFKRLQNPDDEQFQVRGVNAVRLIMCCTAGPFFLVLWVFRRHEEAIPEPMLTLMLAIGVVGLFVSGPFMIAHSVMEFVARRRKRNAHSTESIPEL